MPKTYMAEYKEYAKESDKEVLAYLIDTLLNLWFKPKEPLSKFKEWFWKRIKKYNITWAQLEHCIDNYYDYWSEVTREIKNFKTSFFNNPYLRNYLWKEYENQNENKFYNINNV